MWNQPTNRWQNEATQVESAWGGERAAGLRLIGLWLACAVPLVVVAVRVAQLQLELKDEFAAGVLQTYVVREEIPARDGRILAADGSVLAEDMERFHLQVHYRMIDQPFDKSLLRQEALRRLNRRDRQQPALVTAMMNRVQAERDAVWQRLAMLTNRSPDELASSRQTIQARVERIRDAVIRRREAVAERQRADDAAVSMVSTTGWITVWNRVRRELTQPPVRQASAEPIAEEEGFHTIITDIDTNTRDEIEAHPERYPQTRISLERHRSYPHGELASHVLGSRRPLTVEDLAARRQRMGSAETQPDDYRVGDRAGREGLELQYDSLLHGRRGERRLIKNRRGETVASEVIREPQHGRDLMLSLDKQAQEQAERLLDQALETVTVSGTVDDQSSNGHTTEATCPQGGCLVLLDVHTGAVIAAASAPRFDLNLLVAPEKETWNDLLADQRKPLFPRVTHMALPPGSVFKIISAVASAESGKLPPDSPLPCRGFLDRPDHYRCLTFRHHGVGHGDTTLPEALCRSCNVYFFTAARRMGPEWLVGWADQFGMGQRTGIDLPSESAGKLPSPKGATKEKRWTAADTLGLAIGQGELLVTPLQMARAMAVVANGGLLVTPRLASGVGSAASLQANDSIPAMTSPEPRPLTGLNPETLEFLQTGLTMVVHDPRGTAYHTGRLKEVTIAGKTGTAEVHGRIDHAWFAGYVPAEAPRFAFVVALEHGGSGGKGAAPVARQFVSHLLESGLLQPAADVAQGR